MKALRILFTIVILLVILLVAGAHFYLSKNLTTLVQEKVLPKLDVQYGIQAHVTDVSYNLFTGQAVVKNIVIDNPPGFEDPALLSVETFKAKLELLSLFSRDPIIFKSIHADGLRLVIERNASEQLNLEQISLVAELDQRATTALAEAPVVTNAPETAVVELPVSEEAVTVIPDSAPTSSIPLHIRRLSIDGVVVYRDAPADLNIPLKFHLTSTDLFSIPAENHPDSLIVLRGSHAEKPSHFVIDLQALLKPVTDPEATSFDLSGGITQIDANILKGLLEKNDVQVDYFSVKPTLICKKGTFQNSHLDFVVNNFVYQKTRLSKSSFNLPLTGTLENPQLDLTHALQSLFINQSGDILKALSRRAAEKTRSKKTDSTSDLPASDDEIRELSDQLIDSFENGIKALEEDEDLKKSLKNLQESFFGK